MKGGFSRQRLLSGVDLTVVLGLVPDWAVVDGAVQPAGVEPTDPRQGDQLKVVDAAAGSVVTDASVVTEMVLMVAYDPTQPGPDYEDVADVLETPAWRKPATGPWPEWMADWMVPFVETIDGAKKYVVSRTLAQVDWNAELVQGDLEQAVRQLKQEPGNGLFVSGLTLPLALADLGLIDEYELVVLPVLAGHGPRLFDGLSERLELKLVGREEFQSGAQVLRYVPTRVTA